MPSALEIRIVLRPPALVGQQPQLEVSFPPDPQIVAMLLLQGTAAIHGALMRQAMVAAGMQPPNGDPFSVQPPPGAGGPS